MNNLSNPDPDENFFNGILPEEVCRYYTIQQYCSLVQPNSVHKTIRILNHNVCSFHSKTDQIISFIASLNQPELLVISETWNTPNNIGNCKIDGYNSVHTHRKPPTRGGGISIFAKCEFEMDELPQFSVCAEYIEICVAKIKISNETICLIGIYRPPDGNISEFLASLGNLLSDYFFRNYVVVIAGDMNININNPNALGFDEYLALLNSYALIPVIDKPTRLPPNSNISPANLDHIFINRLSGFHSGIIYSDLSDHCPSFLNLNANVPLENSKIKITYRPYSEENFNIFCEKILQTDWNSTLNLEDLNLTFQNFSNMLNAIYCESFPSKTKFLSTKRLMKPWLSQHLLKKIKTKSYYFKLFKMGLISRLENDRFKTKVNKLVRKFKTDYYINKFDQFRTNIKKSWETINCLMGRNYLRKPIEKITMGGITVSEEMDIAEYFNNFFCNIAQTLDEKLPPTTSSPTQYCTNFSENMSLPPISEDECIAIISKLKLTKNSVDEIPIHIFIKIRYLISHHLSKLLNLSLESSLFPGCLKIGRLTPVYKSGNPSDPANYRPIASLPYLSKILERCVANRLNSHLSQNAIISQCQFGFQKNKSTSSALFQLTEKIYNSINNRKYFTSVFIDLKKAFDTVNHEILLQKMELAGIRGAGLDWFRSYLSDREYFVRVGNFNSRSVLTNIGLPQGSILGPICFLIYINDLPNLSNICNFTLFADDTTVSLANNNLNSLLENLNYDLDKIVNWSNSNRLSINASKTEAIIFTTRPISSDPCLELNNELISFKNHTRFLGVFLDSKMRFDSHVSHVLSKLSKNAGILFKIRDCLPMEARLKFYYSFMYPYLVYNVLSWGSASDSVLYPLIIQQKRIVRTICNSERTDHSSPLFYRLKLLKLKDIFKYELCLHMYDNLSNEIYSNHNVPTRNSNLLRPTFQRLTVTQRAVSFQGPTAWNSLPAEIKNLSSKNVFKNKLKTFLLSLYV